ncbi:MAG: alcohol dehydrogenase catalytic domain-containing protein [Desulfofustis sp.]|nr:alcohol dehydrogenase catalytic domain-containing protein [Desulfofustis sp.]NNK57857.1 alcohol dehydrogenase catalytic domain-containing protein [Desulfofustis sp.]
MRELYLERPRHLEMRESTPVDLLKDSEVRIKISYGGICGSDIRVLQGTLPYAQYPCRPGHEILGSVLEAGRTAPFKKSDRVISYPNTYCGSCEFCIKGKTNICASKQTFGVTINGLFGEEVVADAKYLVPVPDDLSSERAILTEPLAVNVHALKKVKIEKGTTVAVVGCGIEGLLSTALLHHLGADLTVIDINPAKIEKAKSAYPNIKTLHPGEIKDQLFDVVIEAAGVKEAIEQAFTLVKPGGTLITLGITDQAVSFPSLHVTRSEMTIFGSIIYTKDDFEDAFRYLKNPQFDISPVIAKILPFKEYEQAFADASSGNYTKIILDFHDSR